MLGDNMKIILLLVLVSCSSFRTRDLLPGHTKSQHESWSDNIMIATQGVGSTQAGLEMFRKGGNIFDAATAITFAISVERPQSTGLGGGGFMLINHEDLKEPLTYDFREKAPAKAHEKMFLDKKGNEIPKISLNGPLASGVPGLVHGILTIHKKYGKLPLKTVMQPAIDLAEKGFKVYPHLENAIESRKEVLKDYPASLKIFYKDGKPLKVGDHLIQKDLAKTLKTIANKGKNGFYRGWVARAIVREMKRTKGLISLQDLRKYNTITRKPVKGTYRDYEIYSMAPPSSGGIHVIQILNLLEPFKLRKHDPQSDFAIHTAATAMQISFVDRARYLGDADFVKVPVDKLISKPYANELRKMMGENALKLSPDMKQMPKESNDTTHFTIMDKKGNVVSSTQTINYLLGSGQVIPGTGIVMNDEMDDFSTKPGAINVFGAVGSIPNRVQPYKRPLSSMSPTLVKKNGKTVLALGTPSGTRILTCVAQTILNYVEYQKPLYDAVAMTRLHHQWKPDSLRIGAPYFSNATMKKLEQRGHKVLKKDLGCKIQAVALENSRLHGVSDPRGEGEAKGF